MSLLSKIGKFVKRAARNPLVSAGLSFVPGGAIAGRVLTGLNAAANVTTVAQAIPRSTAMQVRSYMPGGTTLPQLPSAGGFRTGGTLASFNAGGAGGACGVPGYHYAKDGSGRLVRNRRMNPLNPQAARRAIRRVKGAMKMLKAIERQLPTRTVRRRSA